MTADDWDEYRKLVMHELESVDERLDHIERQLDNRLDDLDDRLDEVETTNEASRVRWHVATWAATTVTVTALGYLGRYLLI